MKKLVLVVAISLCLAGNAFAEDKKETNKATAGDQKQQVVIKTIFAYQKELGLSDKQIQDLKDKLANFQKYLLEKREVLIGFQKELNEMLTKREALKLIRNKLEQIANTQVDISYTDVETSRKIESTLTSGQLDKWKVLQADARKEAQKQIEEAQKAAKEKKTDK